MPGKCQNKMCWLRSGDEKSIPGFPEANPSTSQHPSQAEELVIWQFSSAPWTAPQIRLHIPTRPRGARHVDWHHGQRKGQSRSHIHGSLPPGSREKSHSRETHSHSAGCSLVRQRTVPANVARNFHSYVWRLLNSCCVPGPAPDTEEED